MIFVYVLAGVAALAAVLAALVVALAVVLRESRMVLETLVGSTKAPAPVQPVDVQPGELFDQGAEVVRIPPWELWGRQDVGEHDAPA